jgi:hypothetical protein
MPSASPAFCTTGKYECVEQNEQRAPTLTDALQSGGEGEGSIYLAITLSRHSGHSTSHCPITELTFAQTL